MKNRFWKRQKKVKKDKWNKTDKKWKITNSEKSIEKKTKDKWKKTSENTCEKTYVKKIKDYYGRSVSEKTNDNKTGPSGRNAAKVKIKLSL